MVINLKQKESKSFDRFLSLMEQNPNIFAPAESMFPDIVIDTKKLGTDINKLVKIVVAQLKKKVIYVNNEVDLFNVDPLLISNKSPINHNDILLFLERMGDAKSNLEELSILKSYVTVV